MKKKMQILCIGLSFLILYSMLNIDNNILINETSYNGEGRDNYQNVISFPKTSGYWNNFSFIHITGTNWTTAASYDWVSGSGTWGDPYIIENITIDATNSPIDHGIYIENSANDYFIIRNVTIFNASSSTFAAGIKFKNTNNGSILFSNVSSSYWGISFQSSNNKKIQQTIHKTDKLRPNF